MLLRANCLQGRSESNCPHRRRSRKVVEKRFRGKTKTLMSLFLSA
jgi:hypothetical protein